MDRHAAFDEVKYPSSLQILCEHKKLARRPLKPGVGLKIMTYKFGKIENNQNEEHFYNNVYAHDVYDSWTRVTIGPSEKQIPLMLKIAKSWGGPYGILYVLSVPRLGHNAARYQSPNTYYYDDIELFTYTFQEYFEGDGRHHIWIIDVQTNNRIIYDNHNILYVYGNDEPIMKLLENSGFSKGEVIMPTPHEHKYNQEFDKFEDEIMEYFEWIESPLQDEHDD